MHEHRDCMCIYDRKYCIMLDSTVARDSSHATTAYEVPDSDWPHCRIQFKAKQGHLKLRKGVAKFTTDR